MSNLKPVGSKGLELEEVLRNYFLESNFFVLRGVPLRMGGEDFTDIDIWLYERPAGFSRRRMIVDAKFKTKPKAAERIFWVKGAAEYLGVDDAYVATTDARPVVREMARRTNVAVFDGGDLQRIAASDRIRRPNRLTNEEFLSLVRAVDTARRGREWSAAVGEVKGLVLEELGFFSLNRSLIIFGQFAEEVAIAPQGSSQAETATRAALFAASIAAISLDFVSAETAFRTADERHRMLCNGIRFGKSDRDEGLEKVRVATSLVKQFAENGGALANQIENAVNDESDAIPAEIIADHVVRLQGRDELFEVARGLEAASHSRSEYQFDRLSVSARSLIGTFLDFCGIARKDFAVASPSPELPRFEQEPGQDAAPSMPLKNLAGSEGEAVGDELPLLANTPEASPTTEATTTQASILAGPDPTPLTSLERRDPDQAQPHYQYTAQKPPPQRAAKVPFWARRRR